MNTMKNKLLLALSAILLVLVGCSPEEAFLNEDVVSLQFTVDLDEDDTPGDMALRKASDPPSRCIMEVYEGITATGTPILRKEQSGRVFDNVILTKDHAYTVLFWADLGTATAEGETPAETNEYDASDLKAVKLVPGMQATRPAYAACSKFTVGEDDDAITTQLTLKHAVAKVQFKQQEALTSDVNTLVVTYPSSNSLNVDGMSTEGIFGEVRHSFTHNSYSMGTLGTDYLFAASGVTSTVMDITSALTSGGVTTTKQLTSIPFKCDYLTRINGAYSDLYNSLLTVSCNDQWEGDKKSFFPIPKHGDYFYIDNTFSTARDVDKTVVGIVFWVNSENPAQGKIVSLDEAFCAWSTEQVEPDAHDRDNGLNNQTAVLTFKSNDLSQYPAFNWCVAKNTPAVTGISWYLPARNEVSTLFSWWIQHPDGINAIITNSGVPGAVGITSTQEYWSSTQFIPNAYMAATMFIPNVNVATTKWKWHNAAARAISSFTLQ